MFGLFKKNNEGHKAMKMAMIAIQSKLASDGLGQEMRLYQKGLFPELTTFKAYAATYEVEGLTEIGGLAKFCLNAVNKTVEPIESGSLPLPFVVDLAEKLCYVVKALHWYAEGKSITEKDRSVMEAAEKAANSWLANEQRVSLLEQVEFKLNTISQKYGVAGSAVNPEQVIAMMKSW